MCLSETKSGKGEMKEDVLFRLMCSEDHLRDAAEGLQKIRIKLRKGEISVDEAVEKEAVLIDGLPR